MEMLDPISGHGYHRPVQRSGAPRRRRLIMLRNFATILPALAALLLLTPATLLAQGAADAEGEQSTEAEETAAPDDASASEEEGEGDEEAGDEALEEEEGYEEEVEENPYEPEVEAPTVPRTLCHGRMIRDIEVDGARRVDPDDVRATMRLRRGLPCTDDELHRDAQSLWDLGFFDDLVFEARPAGEEITLHVHVRERPAIADVTFVGNDEVSDEDIDEKVTLRNNSILSVPDVRRQVQRIRDLYAEEGYFLARVEYELVRLPGENNEVEVRFNIEEGQEVEVRQIRFVGNRNIPADDLTAIMQTSEVGFFSFLSGANFDSSAFEEDITRLQAWYYDQGYLTMQVGTPRIELTPDRAYIDITIPIQEGPRFRIGRLSVTEVNRDGAEVEALADDLREEIDLDGGDWFSRSSIAVGLQEITRVYRDAGYARVQVSPETDLDDERRIVDLRVQILRGPPVRIERINITGNTKTRDGVIRRELQILEGELYSQTGIERSKRRVTALGYFERADISEEAGSRDDLIVLNIEVVEKPTGTFQVGAGFSSIEQFILTAQVQQNNLFGNGQSLSLQLQLSGIRQLIQVRFVEPWLFGTQWSGSVEAFKTVRQFVDFTRDSTGGGLMFGHPLFDPRLRLFFGYRGEYIQLGQATGGLFGGGVSNAAGAGIQSSSSGLDNALLEGFLSSLRLSVTWDNRNNRQFPSDGFYASYSAQLAERFLGSAQPFLRQTAFIRFYRQLWGPLVFKVNLEGGLITSRDDRGVPLYERFFLGGIFNVRGYPLNSLGPRAALLSNPGASPRRGGGGVPAGTGIGGNLQLFYQAELEFPILASVGIRGVLFTDGGNAWNLEDARCGAPATENDDPTTRPCGFDPLAIRTSVGFGLRWFSPLGPLRFEWGIPLARRSYENPIRFEFTIGNSF